MVVAGTVDGLADGVGDDLASCCGPVDEAARQALYPRTVSSTESKYYTYNREDGRFFASLRITSSAVTVREICRLRVGSR